MMIDISMRKLELPVREDVRWKTQPSADASHFETRRCLDHFSMYKPYCLSNSLGATTFIIPELD
jgi:hypothetical protein